MRKWLALAMVLAAGAAEAQPVSGGLLGRGASYSSFVTPSGCTTGSMATFLGSLTCVPGLTYAGGVLSVPGAVSAQNFNAIPLPAAGAVTVTPTLSQLGGITVVAGAALADGDALSVGDGVGVIPIEFDASPGDGTTGGAVAIVFDGTESATDIRDAVKAILDGAGRDWTTSAQAANGIGLVRATPGATGGAITEDVTAAGFTVTNWTDPTHATTYTYSLQACAAGGACTAAGAASSTAAGVLTLSVYNLNRLSWSAVTGAASYKIRRDVGGATQGVIWSGTALTVDDTGLAGDGSAKPTTDGTGTVTAARIAASGSGTLSIGKVSSYVGTLSEAFGGASMTAGKWSVAFGYNTLAANQTAGESNTAIGYNALSFNTTGGENTAVGTTALHLNTTASGNLAVGVEALAYNTTGGYNTALGGYDACLQNTTGAANVCVGYGAHVANTTGGYNTVVGSNALLANTGSYNAIFGYSAGYSAATADRSVFLGTEAGYYETGDNKLFIDNAKRASEADGRAKALVYGTFGTGPADQSIAFNGAVTSSAGSSTGYKTLSGILNVNTTAQATTGTSEEILVTYTLPANALAVDGQMLRIRAFGTSAANTNSKSARIRFGGIGGPAVSVVSTTTASAHWTAEAVVIRTGAATQVSNGVSWYANFTSFTTVAAPTATLSGAVDIVVTGTTATSAGDLTFTGLVVELLN